MELILLQDVEKVGRKGEVVRVKEGFGRNFLLPRGYGLVANSANKKFVDDLKARAAKRREQEKDEAEGVAQKLKNVKIKLERQAGENEKLFGSVTADDIREALEERSYKFDKKQIQLKDPIRTLGAHQVTVEVYPQVKATLSIEVVAKA
ncbi:MAG TPA: 50S ribosomal protein L9 [Verrucomicrobiae bacterium]|jgi:large subunit ribosomal protein L9|nr:50S ribosomal protein L9 [Verrucomicrobiae bacterium]